MHFDKQFCRENASFVANAILAARLSIGCILWVLSRQSTYLHLHLHLSICDWPAAPFGGVQWPSPAQKQQLKTPGNPKAPGGGGQTLLRFIKLAVVEVCWLPLLLLTCFPHLLCFQSERAIVDSSIRRRRAESQKEGRPEGGGEEREKRGWGCAPSPSVNQSVSQSNRLGHPTKQSPKRPPKPRKEGTRAT